MEIETDEIVEVWAEHITRARHYRAVLLVMGACMALTLLALWGVARRPHPAPVVVRVDEVGRAEAVDYLPEAIEPAGPEVSYFLHEFVAAQYARQRAVVEARWEESLWFTSAEVGAQLSAEYGEEVAEFIAGARGEGDIVVENVRIRVLPNPAPPHDAEIAFDRVRIAAGRVLGSEPWSVNLQFAFTEVTPDLVFSNPIGLVITFLEDTVVRTTLPEER